MTYDICIIGGGFSGLMVLHHLAAAGGVGLRVCIVEPKARLGVGAAYSTPHVYHLLNVPAGNMSALPDAPAQFTDWLQTDMAARAMKKLGIATAVYGAGDYVPRALYAFYLESIKDAAFASAAAQDMDFRHVTDAAVGMERGAEGAMQIHLRGGDVISCRKILLAIGNLPAPADTRTVTDVFGFDYQSLRNEARDVAIIGTGLTMVDTLLSLRAGGYRGNVVAVSRGGRLPQVHDGIALQREGRGKALAAAPQNLRRLMRAFRADVVETIGTCGSWQPVFAYWRPFFPALWRGMDARCQQRFLRRLFSLWNIHRHRMAPEIGDAVAAELAAGTLRIAAGAVQVSRHADALRITAGNENIDVQRVFDCRGPGYRLAAAGHVLLDNMLAQGLIAPHASGFGLSAAGFNVRARGGEVLPDICAMGPLLMGERLETTAVPELRVQAKDIAAHLAGTCGG